MGNLCPWVGGNDKIIGMGGGGGGRGGRTGGEEEREEEGGGICNIVESWTGIRYIIQNVMSVGTETLGHQNPCLT